MGGRLGRVDDADESRTAAAAGYAYPLQDGTRLFAELGKLTCFTAPFDATGQPAISLPLHWAGDGLPIGVQLIAGFGREDVLFRLASQLESALPWADRWPEIAGLA